MNHKGGGAVARLGEECDADKWLEERMKRAKTCPSCKSDEVLPIVYGKPGKEFADLWERGKVVLGGCVPRGAEWYCKGCGNEYNGKGA